MRACIALLTVLCTLAAVPAAAQNDPPIGSRLGKRDYIRSEHDPKASVIAAHRMAGCVYLKQGPRVNAALSSLESAEAARRLNALGSKGTCINLHMRSDDAEMQRIAFPLDVYRGMLAEAALRQDFGSRSPEALPRQRTYSRPWFAATGRPLVVDEMGACVADTDPAGLKALLTTSPESPQEKAAFSRLMPSIGPCLTAGATLNANRQSLRVALAEALYHRIRGNSSAPASAGGAR